MFWRPAWWALRSPRMQQCFKVFYLYRFIPRSLFFSKVSYYYNYHETFYCYTMIRQIDNKTWRFVIKLWAPIPKCYVVTGVINWSLTGNWKSITIAQCKTVVYPLLSHWSYLSFALTDRYDTFLAPKSYFGIGSHLCVLYDMGVVSGCRKLR